ncbi:MAG: hypothetical protein PWP34_2450, partial [Desulfuromonadales bacterium]|nr:hypothetical protein [Desulfuromonadales bacterium]
VSPGQTGGFMGEPLKAVGSNLGPPKGGWLFEQVQLIQSAIFSLLTPDVISNDLFVAPHGRCEISTGPKILAREIPRSPTKGPGNMNGTFTLDVSYDLSYRIFGRDRDIHMNVVRT